MSRPAYLPPLPRVETAAPPNGFATAIRAAGRRRWRRAGTALGGGLTALLLLAVPAGGPGGTAGLEPTGVAPTTPPPTTPPPPAVTPSSPPPTTATPSSPPATAPSGGPGPTAVPRTSAAPGAAPAPTPAGPDAAPASGMPAVSPTPTPPGSPTPTPTSTPSATPTPAPSPDRVPWRRSEVEADRTYVAACVADDDSSLGNGGTRRGDWCLTAGVAETNRKTARLTLQACPAAPGTPPLTFADGRELDFVVRDGDRDVWSSATGRTFPAAADPVETAYGYCAEWRLTWVRVGDDQQWVGPGDYTLLVTLRAVEGYGTDRTVLTLAD